MPARRPLTSGNTAKLYCLQEIEKSACGHTGAMRLVDFGCGNAAHLTELLSRYPNIHYIGWDPDDRAVEAARINLANVNAKIHCGVPYHVRLEKKADAIISFSVLEHVVNRHAYLLAIKENLAEDGRVYINYDAGHFYPPASRRFFDSLHGLFGTGLVRLMRNARAMLGGMHVEYQAFVPERTFRDLLDDVGLRIVEEKFFNTPLKTVYKLTPETSRDEYMRRWLEFELWLNDQGIMYGDEMAAVFSTRNFILTHS